MGIKKTQLRTIFFVLILLCTFLFAEEDSLTTEPTYIEDTLSFNIGYLIVECDSSGINIYVDEMLVGQIPIEKPIPLPTGKHSVTYLQPRFIELLDQYYEKKEVTSLISKSFQTVYIIPDDTISVNLWWRPYERELRSRKARFWAKSTVGVFLLITFLSLNIP